MTLPTALAGRIVVGHMYILVVAAVRKGHDKLAAALRANDLDTLEDILDSLVEKENA